MTCPAFFWLRHLLPQVDNPIGALNDLRLCSITTMEFPASTRRLQHLEQAINVGEMQPVVRVHPECTWCDREHGAQPVDVFDTLGFAAGSVGRVTQAACS